MANAADLYIGARKPGNTILLQGSLDEIAIYNRILTEGEIKAAFQGNIPDVSIAVAPRSDLITIWGKLKTESGK
jgi:hypothetical protein